MGSSQTKNPHSVVEVSSSAETDHQTIKEAIQLSTYFSDKEKDSTDDTSENRCIRSVHSVHGSPIAAPTFSTSDANDPITTKCVSCAVYDKQDVYHWELIDSNVLQTALNFREELIPWKNTKNELKKKVHTINKGYLSLRLDSLKNESEAKKIRDLFKEAMQQCKPELIIKAYSLSKLFSGLLNNDMARIVLHDIAKGCSKFSCDTLYTTQDGTKSIASILFYHPEFITYEGTVYRGMFSRGSLTHIQVNHCIMTNTFLSTSKSVEVADTFSGYDRLQQCLLWGATEDDASIFCTYIIKNINGHRRALDISGISRFPDEEEVLLMPYSVFLVTKRETIELPNKGGKRIELELEECDEAQLRSSLTQQ